MVDFRSCMYGCVFCNECLLIRVRSGRRCDGCKEVALEALYEESDRLRKENLRMRNELNNINNNTNPIVNAMGQGLNGTAGDVSSDEDVVVLNDNTWIF